jgi:hypothetical protein
MWTPCSNPTASFVRHVLGTAERHTPQARAILSAFKPEGSALAEALPDGEACFLEGQGHDDDMTALAPVLAEFFNG